MRIPTKGVRENWTLEEAICSIVPVLHHTTNQLICFSLGGGGIGGRRKSRKKNSWAGTEDITRVFIYLFHVAYLEEGVVESCSFQFFIPRRVAEGGYCCHPDRPAVHPAVRPSGRQHL